MLLAAVLLAAPCREFKWLRCLPGVLVASLLLAAVLLAVACCFLVLLSAVFVSLLMQHGQVLPEIFMENQRSQLLSRPRDLYQTSPGDLGALWLAVPGHN